MGYYFNDSDRAIEGKDDAWSPAEILVSCLTFWTSPLNMDDKYPGGGGDFFVYILMVGYLLKGWSGRKMIIKCHLLGGGGYSYKIIDFKIVNKTEKSYNTMRRVVSMIKLDTVKLYEATENIVINAKTESQHLRLYLILF